MNYQERLSAAQVLDILDREVGKKQDNPIGIKNLYSILYELNQRQESTFIPEEQSNYIVTANRLGLVYGAVVNGVLVQEGIIVNQGGLIYTLINNDPSLTSSWVEITNTGLVTFPDLQVEGASSINYNNIFNKPVAAEGINVIEVQARSTANISGTYDNGVAGIGATLITSGALTTLDGYTLIESDLVALINQTDAKQNGIYEVTTIGGTTTLTRATVADETLDLYPSEITVANGTLYGNRKYRQVTIAPVIGTDNIEYQAITIDDVSAPSYVSGATIYVDRLSNYATDTRTGLSKYNRDRPFSTIQAAITAMASGDIIEVKSGTYTENLTFSVASIYFKLEPNVTITGTITYNNNGGVQSDLRIIGSGATSLITSSSASATITNGSTSNVVNTCHLRLSNVSVSNTSTGNAISSTGANSQLTIENNCIITGTTGVLINRYSVSGQSKTVIKDSTLSNTTGGIYGANSESDSERILVNNCDISTTGNLIIRTVSASIAGKWKNNRISCSRIAAWGGASSDSKGDLSMIGNNINASSASTALDVSPITSGTKVFLIGNNIISGSATNIAFSGVTMYAYNNTSNATFPAFTAGANNTTDANLDSDLI